MRTVKIKSGTALNKALSNSTPNIEPNTGREIKQTHTFKKKGTFESVHLAQQWCKENGYEVGSMARHLPRGLAKTEKCSGIAKWYNLDESDKEFLDGVMVSDDFREGSVTIHIF